MYQNRIVRVFAGINWKGKKAYLFYCRYVVLMAQVAVCKDTNKNKTIQYRQQLLLKNLVKPPIRQGAAF